MPRKGSTFDRSPQRHRTRSDGLPLHIQQHLIVDAQSGLFDLNDKGNLSRLLLANPALYGNKGEKLYKSCYDKLRYYILLKDSNPGEYYRLYASALKPDPTTTARSNLGYVSKDTTGSELGAEKKQGKATPRKGTPRQPKNRPAKAEAIRTDESEPRSSSKKRASSTRSSSSSSSNRSGNSGAANKKQKIASAVSNEKDASSVADPEAVQAILANLDTIKDGDKVRVDIAEKVFGSIATELSRANNGHEYLMKRIVDADGIALATTIMKNNPGEEGLQEQVRALLDLFLKKVKEKPEKEWIEVVYNIMKTLSDDVTLQAKCCETLWHAAKNQGFSEFVGESGGIPLIVSAMKDHPNDDNILPKGFRALGCLTYHAGPNRQRVVDAGGIAVVVDALNRHSKNASVGIGITVLANLACQEAQAARVFGAGGHVEVASVMKNHPREATIQEYGCCFIGNMTILNPEDSSEKIADTGAIPLIIEAMKQHPNQVGLQKHACRAIRNLSKGGKDRQNSIVQAGGLVALASAISAHPSDNYIRTHAKESWNTLVDSM